MSTNIENGIFKAMVDGELKEVRFQTGADNVLVTEGDKEITLAKKLESIEAGEGGIQKILVNGEELEISDEDKSVGIQVPNITVGETQPESMKTGDLFIQIVSSD